jgi:hypothetical protein
LNEAINNYDWQKEVITFKSFEDDFGNSFKELKVFGNVFRKFNMNDSEFKIRMNPDGTLTKVRRE